MRWWKIVLVGMLASCGWPDTKLEPAADFTAARRPTVSAAPAYTAGPTTVLTTSPDGATRFICADGGSVAASTVPPDSRPAC